MANSCLERLLQAINDAESLSTIRHLVLAVDSHRLRDDDWVQLIAVIARNTARLRTD